MKLVTIESPLAKRNSLSVEDNIEFARRVCRWAITQRSVAPYASHLFYTQPNILDEKVASERALGIEAGLLWASKADEAWFCLRANESPSPGMLAALDRYRYLGTPMYKLVFDTYPLKLLYEEGLT